MELKLFRKINRPVNSYFSLISSLSFLTAFKINPHFFSQPCLPIYVSELKLAFSLAMGIQFGSGVFWVCVFYIFLVGFYTAINVDTNSTLYSFLLYLNSGCCQNIEEMTMSGILADNKCHQVC